MRSADDTPPELPPIAAAIMAVTLESSCLQAATVAPELGSGVFLGPTGALLLAMRGQGLVLQFGSLEDIARLRDVIGIVHDAHARREAFEAAARDAKRPTVPGAGHA